MCGAVGARRRGAGGEGTLPGSAGFGHGGVAGFEFVEDLVSRGCAPGGPVGEAAEDGGVEGVGLFSLNACYLGSPLIDLYWHHLA